MDCKFPRGDHAISRSTILFDFGGTLDADGLRWCVRFHQAYQAQGGRLSLDEFEPIFKQSDRLLERVPDIRGLDFSRMVERQAELVGALLPKRERIDTGGLARIFQAESAISVRQNKRMLERLRDRFRLGVVSNFTGNLDRCLDELGLLSLFDVTVDSAILGTAKPEPAIFQRALQALGADAASSWMVGDNFEADIRPAAALGLSTCWLAERGRPAPTPGLATAQIERLTDLEALLR